MSMLIWMVVPFDTCERLRRVGVRDGSSLLLAYGVYAHSSAGRTVRRGDAPSPAESRLTVRGTRAGEVDNGVARRHEMPAVRRAGAATHEMFTRTA